MTLLFGFTNFYLFFNLLLLILIIYCFYLFTNSLSIVFTIFIYLMVLCFLIILGIHVSFVIVIFPYFESINKYFFRLQLYYKIGRAHV